jgi:HAD superfamily hydrolase (TIGR01509 family)
VSTVPAAVIFDLDGVLLDSEQLWNEAKQEYVAEAGGTWSEDAPRDMMGMSAPEWSAYMQQTLRVPQDESEINRRVVARLERFYREQLPLLPGAVQAVQVLSRRWPLGLASSSDRSLIDLVLELAGLRAEFRVTVSSEEVARGKPAPDVYLEAARQLEVQPRECVAVEDSSNGMRAASAAGMVLIAVPNPHFPPDEDALMLAAAKVETPAGLTPELVLGAMAGRVGGQADGSAAPPRP